MRSTTAALSKSVDVDNVPPPALPEPKILVGNCCDALVAESAPPPKTSEP